MSSNLLLQNAEHILQEEVPSSTNIRDYLQQENDSARSRRLFFASALFATGAAMAPIGSETAWAADMTSLQYLKSPVNKRSGVTVFDAEKDGYNVRFVTYLSRLLLCFDLDCQKWWYSKATDLPLRGTAKEIDELRLKQFGAFSASVEVGLQEYRGQGGPQRLMTSLLSRYCPEQKPLDPSQQEDTATARKRRAINEARRQIAILFGLMETQQPVEEITQLLAVIDNGSIQSVQIVDPGTGYAPEYGPPTVVFPMPEAGDNFEPATGRAILQPTSKILRLDLANRGFGYSKAPVVEVSPPAIAIGQPQENITACTATAKAYIFNSGTNKGLLERIQLVATGFGYTENETIQVTIAPPDMSAANGGVNAIGTAILELEVGRVEITYPGSGYAKEKPISIYIEPPPTTGRVNMNDPIIAGLVDPNQPIPNANVSSKKPNPKQVFLVEKKIGDLASNDGKGGGGGCIGRACYDRPVVAVATVAAKVDSFNTFRNKDDSERLTKKELELEQRSTGSASRVISAASSGPDSALPALPFFGGGPSSSSQLLSLLPAGIGLEYNQKMKRYALSASQGAGMSWLEKGSSRPLDPEFGPRGRSPIEREVQLGLSTYLRFIASGAVCCSSVHFALTPIDVVKTKVQTDPEKYPGIFSAFNTISQEEGAATFFTGWAPTFLGYFVWGGFCYAATEYLRRYFTEIAGQGAPALEVPIILASAGVAAFFGSFIIAPFEAVRIRSVAQPDYAANIVGVFRRMVDEEGFPSLFSAVPVFLCKEIPFAMVKFTIFDLSTAWMYNEYPAACEDLKLSLCVSLVGGCLGGVSAACVSQPADATISELKKSKSDIGPVGAATLILERGGPANFFRGLPLRMIFVSLVVSCQFMVYDAVRFALGIGSDDLKMYLDVLGGALKEGGGPM